jgi:hypothetical protein
LRDDELHDDWVCKDNIWDPQHANCSVAQELDDKQIDEILALQVCRMWAWMHRSSLFGLAAALLNRSMSSLSEVYQHPGSSSMNHRAAKVVCAGMIASCRQQSRASIHRHKRTRKEPTMPLTT